MYRGQGGHAGQYPPSGHAPSGHAPSDGHAPHSFGAPGLPPSAGPNQYWQHAQQAHNQQFPYGMGSDPRQQQRQQMERQVGRQQAPARNRQDLNQMSRQAAAEQRRQHQEQIKAKEQDDANLFSGNLFAAPKKMDPKAADSRFKEVLGDFRALPEILSSTPCIGVDYQPPTPAPSQHIIGEEDDEPIQKVRRPAMIRAPPAANRLPSSLQPPRPPPAHRPQPHAPTHAPSGPPTHAPTGWGNMAPPAKPPTPSVSSQRIKAQSSGLPKIDLHKKSNSFEDLQVDDILRIMKNPLDNGSDNGSSGIPTPLSGIITPRVESFSGNSHTARYQGNLGKFSLGPPGLPNKDSSSSSLFDFSQQKIQQAGIEKEGSGGSGATRMGVPTSTPPARATPTGPGNATSKPLEPKPVSTEGSSNESDSESGESSDEGSDKNGSTQSSDNDSDKNASTQQFSIAEIMKKSKTTSPGSARTADPSPSPRMGYPPTPSPGKPQPLSRDPASLGVDVPSPGLLSVPPIIEPLLSPIGPLSPDIPDWDQSKVTQAAASPRRSQEESASETEAKPSRQASRERSKPKDGRLGYGCDDSSDEEENIQPQRKPPRQKKASKKESVQQRGKKQNNQEKSKEFITDSDSDQVSDKKKVSRHASVSPKKQPVIAPPIKPGSAHSTPPRKRGRPPKAKTVQKLSPKLSESEEEESSKATLNSSSDQQQDSPAPANTKKLALLKMFSGASKSGGGKGGKGKGKGKGGKGGITVVEGGREDRDYHSDNVKKESPSSNAVSPRVQSIERTSYTSPRAPNSERTYQSPRVPSAERPYNSSPFAQSYPRSNHTPSPKPDPRPHPSPKPDFRTHPTPSPKADPRTHHTPSPKPEQRSRHTPSPKPDHRSPRMAILARSQSPRVPLKQEPTPKLMSPVPPLIADLPPSPPPLPPEVHPDLPQSMSYQDDIKSTPESSPHISTPSMTTTPSHHIPPPLSPFRGANPSTPGAETPAVHSGSSSARSFHNLDRSPRFLSTSLPEIRYCKDGRPNIICEIKFNRLGQYQSQLQSRLRSGQVLKSSSGLQRCASREKTTSPGIRSKGKKPPLDRWLTAVSDHGEDEKSVKKKASPEEDEKSRKKSSPDKERRKRLSIGEEEDRASRKRSRSSPEHDQGRKRTSQEDEGKRPSPLDEDINRPCDDRTVDDGAVTDCRPEDRVNGPSHRSSKSHRKDSGHRTTTSETVVKDTEHRKRRDREPSPTVYEPERAKRFRASDEQLEETSSCYPATQPCTPVSPYNTCDKRATSVPLATWPRNLMPPPKVYFSYFEKRQHEVYDDDQENVEEEAKRLKHEADKETNMEAKCMKYLQSILMFSVSANRTELSGDQKNAFTMYNQTLKLVKCICRPLTKSNNLFNRDNVDIRLVVMSLRAQSLLNLRLYKMRKHELKECQRSINDLLTKSSEDDPEAGHISPTPSPAGSEGSNCSKSSGYTSSGETRMPGIVTPPTNPPVCLTIPKNVMQNQFNFCSYLSQCHELWEQADLFVNKGNVEDFFILLDQQCGPLTLHSSIKDLVHYTRQGLQYIEEEKYTSSSQHYNNTGTQLESDHE